MSLVSPSSTVGVSRQAVANDRAIDERSAAPEGMPTWAKFALGAAAVSAVALGALYLVRRSGGALGQAVRQPHTAGVVLTNPHRPWLANTARVAHMDAVLAQKQLFGSAVGHIDDEVDAFRHGYASGLLKLRMMRDHGVGERAASRLVERIGRAHELDGLDNPRALSSVMDLFNNDVGIRLVGAGRAAAGDWIAEPALQRSVLDQLRIGGLLYLQDAGTAAEKLVSTTGATLPM